MRAGENATQYQALARPSLPTSTAGPTRFGFYFGGGNPPGSDRNPTGWLDDFEEQVAVLKARFGVDVVLRHV